MLEELIAEFVSEFQWKAILAVIQVVPDTLPPCRVAVDKHGFMRIC